MKIFIFVTISLALVSAITASLAPLKDTKDSIPGSYIITLKSDSRSTIDGHINLVKSWFTERSEQNKIGDVYENIGKVYHANLSVKVLEQVRNLTEVSFVERDGKVKLSAVQTNAPWGLARISQRVFNSKSTYTYNSEGSGVTVYVIDSGVQVNHPDFGGRAIWGANFISGSPNSDQNGHGTHCAGTVGSRTYGVAKSVDIVAVKVLDAQGSGSWSAIISGINWAAGDKRGKNGNVISISIGGGKIDSVNNAIDAAVNKGIFAAIAAGNDSKDACNYSPASATLGFCVAASDVNDNFATFSNYGSCVDVIAPGVNVLSTWNNGGYNTISGTSMATPHVAGLAAYFLSGKSYTVDQLKSFIKSSAGPNRIRNVPNAASNLLVYNNVLVYNNIA